MMGRDVECDEEGYVITMSCIRCGVCFKVCPSNCIEWDETGLPCIDQTRCTLCGACNDACPARAIFNRGD